MNTHVCVSHRTSPASHFSAHVRVPASRTPILPCALCHLLPPQMPWAPPSRLPACRLVSTCLPALHSPILLSPLSCFNHSIGAYHILFRSIHKRKRLDLLLCHQRDAHTPGLLVFASATTSARTAWPAPLPSKKHAHTLVTCLCHYTCTLAAVPPPLPPLKHTRTLASRLCHYTCKHTLAFSSGTTEACTHHGYSTSPPHIHTHLGLLLWCQRTFNDSSLGLRHTAACLAARDQVLLAHIHLQAEV